MENERSLLQNRKVHAMIADIAAQCLFQGRRWRAESWKRLLIEAYVNTVKAEARANRQKNPFPELSLLVEGIDGETVVQLGVQTRTLSREQMSDFVESMYAYGTEKGVAWSEESKKVIAATRQKPAGPQGQAQPEKKR